MPSTAISRIAYDPETRTLSVCFRPSGELYRYYDVPARVHEAFLKAVAKGRFSICTSGTAMPFSALAIPMTAGTRPEING